MPEKSVILCFNIKLFRLEFDVCVAAVMIDTLWVDLVSLYEVLVSSTRDGNRRTQLLLLEAIVDYCL